MTWELIPKGNSGNRPDWWETDQPGIALLKQRIVFNKAMADILQIKDGSLIVVLLDRPNNGVAFRHPQQGEERGAWVVKKQDGDRCTGIHTELLTKNFTWAKSGLYFKSELVEHGHAAMMVCRHKL